jgi:hypothetical protein
MSRELKDARGQLVPDRAFEKAKERESVALVMILNAASKF